MNKQNVDDENRVDLRDEWYGEWYSFRAASIPVPPRIYWLGMVLSSFWILAYLLIYPSIPFATAQTHWKGIGVPGACRPWTAVCEMQQGEAIVNEVRGKYLNRILAASIDDLAKDSELAEFASRAGRVRFDDNCAGCHGRNGSGIAVELKGDDVRAIRDSLVSEKVHPFGLAKRLSELDARILAIYVYRLAKEHDGADVN